MSGDFAEGFDEPRLKKPRVEKPANQIRIGPEKYGYVYFECGNAYKCERSSDSSTHPDEEVLWLIYSTEQGWVAFDAPKEDDIPEIPDREHIIFSSQENVLIGGWHHWKMLKSTSAEYSSFQTKCLA